MGLHLGFRMLRRGSSGLEAVRGSDGRVAHSDDSLSAGLPRAVGADKDNVWFPYCQLLCASHAHLVVQIDLLVAIIAHVSLVLCIVGTSNLTQQATMVIRSPLVGVLLRADGQDRRP